MSAKHATKAALKKLHQRKAGAAEKGCLTRHQKRTDDHKCSHQWQAKQKALDNKPMYDYPKYKAFCGDGQYKTAALRTGKGKNDVFPRDYATETSEGFMKDRPTHKGKEWNVDKNGNFDHFTKPYWHNAHHIVPNGALKDSINKAGKSESKLPNLIRQGLLRAQYNLNDKVNMVILPQGRNEAFALGLPRHLKGDENGPNEKPEFFSHKDYSDRVEQKLDTAMQNYKKMFRDYLKQDHPPLPNKLAKKKIEKISKDIFKEIKNLSKKYAGEALSQIPTLVKGK